jgi:hypothetical protein
VITCNSVEIILFIESSAKYDIVNTAHFFVYLREAEISYNLQWSFFFI